MSSLAPLLLLIPLAGGLLVSVLPDRPRLAKLRQYLVPLVLLVTTIAIVLAGLERTSAVKIPFWGQATVFGDGLELSLDHLALIISLVMVGAFLMISTAAAEPRSERGKGSNILVLVAMGLGTCSAANLLTMALFWVVTDLLFLRSDLLRNSERDLEGVIRNAFLRLLGVLGLITAALWMAAQVGDTHLKAFVPGAAPILALMAAATIRLGIYPLVQELDRPPQLSLMSLWTGAYLWLRIVGLTYRTLPGAQSLAPAMAIILLISAILASLSSVANRTWAHIRLYGAAMLLYAPLVSPVGGYSISLIIVAGLAVMEALIQLRSYHMFRPEWPEWTQLPSYLLLASLLGAPFSLGFAVQWSLLWLTWSSPWRHLLPLLVISDLFVSLAVWRHIRPWMLQASSHEATGTNRMAYLAVVATSLLFLLIGFTPTALTSLVPGQDPGVRFPTWDVLLSGGPGYWATMVMAAIVLPFGGLLVLRRAWEEAPKHFLKAARTLYTALTLQWLYTGSEQLWGKVRDSAAAALRAIEENHVLGWTLLLGLVAALYLAGR